MLSDRIETLADTAADLYGEIYSLKRELSKRDDLDSVEHLADVPGHIVSALSMMHGVFEKLQSAEISARKGGN